MHGAFPCSAARATQPRSRASGAKRPAEKETTARPGRPRFMLPSLASALAVRDPATAAHSARVTFLAGRLAEWLGWDEERLSKLRFGAPLHDIGKVAVSPEILRKRGPLDQDELAEIRTHRSEERRVGKSDGTTG